MLDSPASGNIDEVLCQGSGGLYVLRVPTSHAPYELSVSPTTVTHFRKPSAAATRLIRSLLSLLLRSTEYLYVRTINLKDKLKQS